MTLDERVIRVLGEMTDDLAPPPDAYDRVRTRWRRRRRRRGAAASVGLVALAAAVVVTAIRVPGGGAPSPGEETNSNWAQIKVWSERMYASPTRGGLAGDTAYVAALRDTLANAQPPGRYRQVKVLFLDDVGPYRVALVAFARISPEPDFWAYGSMWLVGDRGATVDKLAAAANGVGDGLAPYTEGELSKGGIGDPMIQIAIAADGCEFASAPWPPVTDWRPEATGSYLARTTQDIKPEWWRVTCDGVVREEKPAPGWLAREGLTEAQYAAALSGARGVRDTARARDAVMMNTTWWGYQITDLPKVVWQGRVSGAGRADETLYDGNAMIVAAPAVGGGWRGTLDITYDQTDARSNSTGTSVPFGSRTDPTDPSSVVVIPLHDKATFVVTPAAATRVRVVRDGTVVADAPAKDSGAVLPLRVEPGDTVRAADGAGAEVGAVTVDDAPLPRRPIDRWHEE